MSILVTDFDGTMTREDFYWLVLQRHDPPGGRELWRRFERGEVTHFEAMAGIFAALRTDEAGMASLLDGLDPAPGLGEAVRELQGAGWEIIVASAGCGWYIDRFLERQRLQLTVHASPGTWEQEGGLLMELPVNSPFFHPQIGIDKPAVVRAARRSGATVAYAGDSSTDHEACLLVSPERRFARRGLARRLATEKVSCVEFEDWPEIAQRLLASGSEEARP
ncbi:MAG: HAD-IB family phosphatase [Candidatus Krumholzibacteriia bacterium]